MPVFTNRRTLAGEGFWGGWREAVVTDVMPRSYAPASPSEGDGGSGGGGGEKGGDVRVWRKSVVSEVPQTRVVVGDEQVVVKIPAMVLGAGVPKETGSGEGGGGGGTMITTAMPGSETAASVGGDIDGALDGAEAGADEDALTTTRIEVQEVTETEHITELAVVTETLAVTPEVAVVAETDVPIGERRAVVREDL